MIWLFVLIFLLRYYVGDARSALALFVVLFVACPCTARELLNGSDYLANGIWALGALLLAERFDRLSGGARVAGALATGVLLCSRVTFVAVLPVFAAVVWRRNGAGRAAAYCSLVALAFLCLTVPFYLYDPDGYSPIHVVRFVGRFGLLWPHAATVLTVATLLVAAGMACATWRQPERALACSAAVLSMPHIVCIFLYPCLLGRIDPGPYSNFLLPTALFASIPLWRQIAPTGSRGKTPGHCKEMTGGSDPDPLPARFAERLA
jgi:hypothetical protein